MGTLRSRSGAWWFAALLAAGAVVATSLGAAGPAVAAPVVVGPATGLPVPPGAQVTGVITDIATSRPVAGICAAYAPPQDPSDRRGEACSRADGTYALDVDPGHWVLVAADATGKYAASVTDPFDIADGQTLTRALALSVGGGVQGTVVDRVTGAPLADVCPSASLGHDGAYVVGQVATCSDHTGSWSVRGLPAGQGVAVQLGGDQTHVSWWATDGATQQAATVFTPAAGELAAAGTVRLHHGAVLTGKVTNAAGKPVARAW